MLDTFLTGFLHDDQLVDRVFCDEADVCVRVEIAHKSPSGT